MEVRPVTDPATRTAHCRTLTALLPDWFAIPEANEMYATGIAAHDSFAAFDGDETCIGLIALRRHFDHVLEVWWMAVDPRRHRRGVGAALMAEAERTARREGRRELVVMTLGPESDDVGYAATRSFYEAQGFRPLIALDHGPDDDPLIWMLRRLA